MFILANEVATEVANEIASNVDELNNKVSKLSQMTDNIISKLIDLGFDILIAIAIFIVGKIILKLVIKFIDRIFKRSNVDVGVVKFVNSLVKTIGYIVIIITICGQIGIQTTSFITLLGTAGLSVGFALEGCLSNFAGGVLILITKPFKVGDYIITSGVEGTVEKIDIIYTTLSTIDNKQVKLPNGTVSNSVLTNVTEQIKRRVDVEVGIHYEDNIAHAKEVATNVMNSCGYCIKDEENIVVVKALDASSVVLEIRMWTATEDYWPAKFYINEKLKIEFENHDIRIPYNQLDVNIRNEQ